LSPNPKEKRKIRLAKQRQRTPELKAPEKTWGEIATPFLRIDSPSPWFDISLIEPPNNTCNVSVSVRNEGNAASYFTVVDLYEGPFMFITSNLVKDCKLRDRKILTLQPGEEKVVTLQYTRELLSGQAVGICYDPFLDPRNFDNGIGFLASDRKNVPHAVRYGFNPI